MQSHFLVMHLGEGPSNAAPSLNLQNLQIIQLMSIMSFYFMGFSCFLSNYKNMFLMFLFQNQCSYNDEINMDMLPKG